MTQNKNGCAETMRAPLRYTLNVEWSEEDGEWIGTCPAFPSLSFAGRDSRAFALLGIAELVHEAVADGEYGAVVPEGFTVDDLRKDLVDLTETPIRAQVLREAERLVCGDREDQYGSPQENLQRIADYWNRYLEDVDGDIGPRDVALMMVLMKVARESGGYKRDSLVDIAGYAGIAAEAAEAA